MLSAALVALLLPSALASPLLVQRQAAGSKLVHPGAFGDQCLTVVPSGNGQLSNGNIVASLPCGNAGPYQEFDLSRGRTKIRVRGTQFCLDAGTNPHNNVQAKIWQCYDGLQQQDWYVTDDDRIAITGGDQCLDLGGDIVQTYRCTTGNTNQVWKLTGGSTPPPPTSTSISSAAPSSTSVSSAAPSSSSVAPPKPSTGTYTGIHPRGIEGQCLTVVPSSRSPQNGDVVQIYPCNGSANQNWILSRGSTHVCLRNTSYCLDAGVGPHNGVALKVWERLAVPQQQWYFTDDGRIAIEGGNQCADVRDGSLSAGSTIQSWQCTTNNNNQYFTAFNV